MREVGLPALAPPDTTSDPTAATITRTTSSGLRGLRALLPVPTNAPLQDSIGTRVLRFIARLPMA
jgi:hypothetical protein